MNHIELRNALRPDNPQRCTRHVYVNGKFAGATAGIDMTGEQSHTLAFTERVQLESGHQEEVSTVHTFDSLADLAQYLRERFDPELPF